MRTIISIFGFIIICLCIHNTSDNAWTQKRSVEALITEKWEDWSGEATHPYKVMFAVQVTDKSAPSGSVPTTYYERGRLDAHEWNKVVPMQTTRVYTTSYKDLGVAPTKAQESRDNWNSFWLAMLFIWFGVVFIMWMQWFTEL